MKSSFYHVQVNIDFNRNSEFYRALMEFLGWKVIFATEDTAGYKSDKNGDLWFVDSLKKEIGDYDKIGLSHIAIRVDEQKNVDEAVEFIKLKGINPEFETPRHRPEFSSEGETYYQVIFETPDRVQVEIVYIGLKNG